MILRFRVLSFSSLFIYFNLSHSSVWNGITLWFQSASSLWLTIVSDALFCGVCGHALEKCPLKFLAHFFNAIMGLFITEFRNSSYIMGTISLTDIYFMKFFSQSVASLFTFLRVSFDNQIYLILRCQHYWFLNLISGISVVLLRNLCLLKGSKDIFLHFFPAPYDWKILKTLFLFLLLFVLSLLRSQ